MLVAIIITATISGIFFYIWGYGSGKYATELEYKEGRSYVHGNLYKIDKLENYKAQLRNIVGNDDIDAAFTMAIRLIACGVDPKDLITIDRIGMAVAEGKFQFTQSNDDEVQEALDKINGEESKK